MLRTKQGNHPMRIGPILLHHKKEGSYYELASTVVKMNTKTQSGLAYGTDREKALCQDFGRPLPFAVHLLCDLHMKDNISAKLTDLQVPRSISQQYKNDIFGWNVGNIRHPGQIDATKSEEFDEKLIKCLEEWKTRHPKGQHFLDYFIKNRADIIKKPMTAKIRSMAGLGFPPDVYDQNGNECMNSVLRRDKEATGKKELTLPQCVKLLKTAVERQRTEEKLSIFGSGHVTLETTYHHSSVDEQVYYRKTTKQKESCLKNDFEAHVKEDTASVVEFSSPTEQDYSEIVPLSIAVEDSGIIRIPFTTSKQLFHDAILLLSCQAETIVKAPGAQTNLRHIL